MKSGSKFLCRRIKHEYIMSVSFINSECIKMSNRIFKETRTLVIYRIFIQSTKLFDFLQIADLECNLADFQEYNDIYLHHKIISYNKLQYITSIYSRFNKMCLRQTYM